MILLNGKDISLWFFRTTINFICLEVGYLGLNRGLLLFCEKTGGLLGGLGYFVIGDSESFHGDTYYFDVKEL
ncbi:hypothetical protein ACJJI5_07440 [Microbulbifer sp. EKSA008]|uniref:hypothetical protein n=1 Tax=Microbulbifer sp. EKSA008 TaxID=3243367 RepID=UPI004041966D